MVNSFLSKMQNAKCKRYFLYITFYFLLFTFFLLHNIACAAEFDTSINDEIRRKYNPSKLEEDMALPALPKILNNKVSKDQYAPTNTAANIKPVNYSDAEEPGFVRLKKGTKIKLKLMNDVSDNTPKGTKLTFSSIYPVSTTYFTIPAGTLFKGYVVNSHVPQFSGNGGLIVININSMILNNEVQPIEACIVKANSKYIFLNNIKGKRKYTKSMIRSSKPGCNFCKKMFGVTGMLAKDGSSIILTPFSLAAGILGFGGNVFISPALALFYKGGSIALPKGCEVDVKLMQDIFVYL